MMTERPLSISTQNATPIQTVFHSTALNSASDARPVIESAEEEPYTIKCICDYLDDDGNTIYCEKCDTWQHIECFYPGQVDDASREEFDHSCADCKPRPLTLDRRHATERQRLQRQNKAINDSPDKKTKRPPSKSHKKKSKPSELQVNGHHDHDHHKHGSPSDHHPHTKKSKGHRSTQSVSSQMKRSPPLNARPHNHGHPPSPAHTPPEVGDVRIHDYNARFLTLYDGDDSVNITTSDNFASLDVSNRIATWLRSPDKLKEDANVVKKDVFQVLKVPVETLKWPALRIETKKVPQDQGPTLTWRSVRNTTHLSEAGRICPMHGVITFQVDYCNDPTNRWAEAAHPQPFVFFHPQLPLVIDMRMEGSESRYVRRSCRPNTAMESFLAHDTEYHFWLTSERPLAANEQVTIPWDFRFPNNEDGNRCKRLLGLEDEGPVTDHSDMTDEEYETLSTLAYTVLSDHGGCACDLGTECAFVRFHRDYLGRSHTQTNGIKPKKGRKPKQNHVSPTSTGHATNSRAASEGQGDQYEDDDNRSVSGSVRSKPHSRDMTPSHNGEPNGILTENSEREKRKLAALEDSFRKMEQGQPPRKKKRASDGSNMSVSSHTAGAHPTPKPRQRSVAPRASISQASGPPTNGARSHKYVDASTASRRPSGSPITTASPTGAVRSPDTRASPGQSVAYRSRHNSANPKPTYAEASTQTEKVENAWWNESTPKPKRSILTLSKRLLRNRHNIQKQQEARAAQQTVHSNGGEDGDVRASPTVSMDLDPHNHEDRHPTQSPTETKGRKMSIASSTPSVDVPGSVDVAMTDAPAATSATTIKPPPPPWPSQSMNVGSNPILGQKSPDLRVQMPPAPVFSTPNMSAPLSGTGTATPSSASSTAQSPFGTGQFPPPLGATVVNGITPSPVKTTKKLSLSDYAARRKKTDTSNVAKSAPGSSPTLTPAALKPSLSTIEEVKAQSGLEGSAIVESPAAIEKTVNPLAVAGPTSEPLPHTSPSEKSNGAL